MLESMNTDFGRLDLAEFMDPGSSPG